jgi:hypothetical protein
MKTFLLLAAVLVLIAVSAKPLVSSQDGKDPRFTFVYSQDGKEPQLAVCFTNVETITVGANSLYKFTDEQWNQIKALYPTNTSHCSVSVYK